VVELDPAILNEGLDLAMAFGPDWLKPIQSRLAARHPRLGAAELDAYDEACRAAMDFGHRQAYDRLAAAGDDDPPAQRDFEQAVLARHPWISAPQSRPPLLPRPLLRLEGRRAPRDGLNATL
jgi:hypothetical protein